MLGTRSTCRASEYAVGSHIRAPVGWERMFDGRGGCWVTWNVLIRDVGVTCYCWAGCVVDLPVLHTPLSSTPLVLGPPRLLPFAFCILYPTDLGCTLAIVLRCGLRSRHGACLLDGIEFESAVGCGGRGMAKAVYN